MKSVMKRLLTSVFLLLAFCTMSFSRDLVASGKSNTALGDYKIWTADKPAVINGEEKKTFIISYENSPMEVTVVITKGEKCKNFIVLSDKLSVQYICNETYFGVEKLDELLTDQRYATSPDVLDRSQYFHQKVIARGKGSEVDNTMLIAAYFPMLIKENV